MKHDIYLHTAADGTLWSATERTSAAVIMPEDLIQLTNCNRIYILGAKENAKLILDLGRRKLGRKITAPILLGTPLVCSRRQERLRPELVLHLMPSLVAPASLGGWHAMTSFDLQAYSLTLAVSELRAQAKTLDRDTTHAALERLVAAHLHSHPAWPALAFIPGVSHTAALLLLAEIIDPRWYGNPEQPDRTTRLTEYLGVRTKNLSYMLGSAVKRRHLHNADRLVLVMRALFGDGPRPNLTLVQKSPAHFLWRLRDKDQGSVKSLRTAAIFGMNFLRAVWLDALAPRGRALFVPEHFFKYELEAQAFKTHMKGFRGKPVSSL